MKWVLIVVGAVVVLVALAWIVGAFLPREHRATCRVSLRASPAAVFALLADVDGFTAWRPDVKSARRIEPIDGKPAHVEETKFGVIRFAEEVKEPPWKLVLRIADDSLPYGGTWTYTLTPAGTGTTLAITEDGFVKPALFRFLSRFVFGQHGTIEAYLKSLARKLGEDAAIERVE